MQINFNIDIQADRKGNQPKNAQGSILKLSQVIAEIFEKHPNSNLPWRKINRWTMELDKDGIVTINPDEIEIFNQAIDSTPLFPYIKAQIMSILESSISTENK